MKKSILCAAILVSALFTTKSEAQVLLSEDFASGSLPAGWTNDSLGQPAMNLWIFNNQYNRSITGAGFDANFAIFDSDEGSTNDNMDENASLTTPAINLAGASAVRLEFDEQYRALSGPNTQGSSRKIESSLDGGATWTVMVYDSVNVGYPNPAAHTILNIPATSGATTVHFRFTWTGSYDWWWAIDNVNIYGLSPCVAPPTAGTTVSSDTSVCAGKVAYFSLSGSSVGSGITYQWETSSDGVTWIPSANDTLTTFSDTINALTYYHCLVTCSGQSVASSTVSVGLNSFYFCYCSTNLGGGGCGAGQFINSITITGTGFNSTSSTCTNANGSTLTVFPNIGSLTTNLNQGETYPMNVTTDGNHIISVWIDFDRNGTFDATEWTQICTTSASGVVNTANISIPLTATIGLTGMRIRSRANGNSNGATDACSNFGSGEAEDYVVFIDYPLSTKEISQDLGLSAVPNPTSDKLVLSFNSRESENASIQLIGVSGQVVFTESLNQFAGKYAKTLDVSTFAKGIYTLKLTTTNSVTNKKVVIK